MKKHISLSVVTSMAMLLGASFASAATITDHTHYWTFDEGTGQSVGDSVGGKGGSLTGTSTGFGFASGQSGTALGMDGTLGESIVLPDGFLRAGQGSIAVWIKINSFTDRNIYFSARSTIDSHIYAALMIDHEGRPQLQFRTTADGTDQRVQGSKTLNKNEWYQLVFTASGQNYQMFLNGEVLTVAGYNFGRWIPELTNHTLAYRIGSLESLVLNGVFDGYLDDFRVYDRALTQDDVTLLYNGGNAGTPGIPLAAKAALAAPEATSSTSAPIDIVLTPPLVPTSTPVIVPPVVPQTVSVPAVNFARNLSVGSRGDDVRALQLILIKQGYLESQYATGYFGMLTKAAAIQLQKALVLPQTGFVGVMTRAKLNAAN